MLNYTKSKPKPKRPTKPKKKKVVINNKKKKKKKTMGY